MRLKNWFASTLRVHERDTAKHRYPGPISEHFPGVHIFCVIRFFTLSRLLSNFLVISQVYISTQGKHAILIEVAFNTVSVQSSDIQMTCLWCCKWTPLPWVLCHPMSLPFEFSHGFHFGLFGAFRLRCVTGDNKSAF